MIRSRFSILPVVLLVAFGMQTNRTDAEPPHESQFRVRDFGAAGNATTLDTAAIQKTIDACSNAGGGTVYFSPGVYLSGTIFLKDNVRLLLETNAVLRGSPRIEDYPAIARKNALGKPAFSDPTFSGGGFLIYADGVQNVSIEGRGTIDGQGPAFWFKEMLSPAVRKPMPKRPRAMIGIVKAKNLLFRDVTLLNSPCFTLWLIGCNNANIDGVTIRNPHDGPNTDGIDVDCCNDVRIANCSIDGGDDAIALKSDSGLLGENKPCENIAVSNCVLCSVPACGVRVGYEGDAEIRNCTFSNLTIFDTNIGLDIVSVRPGGTIVKGTRCENIAFNNIVMRHVDQAIYFWMGHEPGGKSQISLKNILVSNVIAQSKFGSCISGCPLKNIEDVTLSNIRFIATGTMSKNAPLVRGGVWGGPNPCALYCSHIDGLRLKDIDIDLRNARGVWQYGVFCENVNDAQLRGIQTRGLAAPSAQGVIGLKKSTASVRDCDAEPQLSPLVRAVDNSRVFVSGCNLRGTTAPFVKDNSSTIDQFTDGEKCRVQ
jgi:hypothetical protein